MAKVFRWKIDRDGSSESTRHAKMVLRFGDGYSQAVSFGINSSAKTWQCTVTDKKAVIDEIYRFLNATKGVEPFEFKPVDDEPSIKVRLEGEPSRNEIGAGAWRISFAVEQVF